MTVTSEAPAVVNATDPLNLVGLIVPGDTVPAVRTNQVMYVDGLQAERPGSLSTYAASA
jgi:hypothetical protein